MIWLVIGGLATAYLAVLGVRPDVLASGRPSLPDLREQIDGARREMSRAFADLDPMRRTMGEIKMDVANLKEATQAGERRDEMIIERVTALETAQQNARSAPTAQTGSSTSSKATAATPATPPTPTQNPRKASGASNSAPGSEPAPKVSAATPAKKTEGSIETGSIEEKKAKAPSKPVGILIATGPSLDALRLNWSILIDRHSDAVGSLSPRYVTDGPADKRTYTLVLGPVPSAGEAKNLCKTLIERGMTCEVSVYRGNAL
jgi:cell division septation protein DedD